jgi:hypothetical protein
MFGRKLFENDEFILYSGFFGGMKVFLKDRGITIKARSDEKTHFLLTADCLYQLGSTIAPGSPEFGELAEAFCSALPCRGTALWAAHFHSAPGDLATLIAEDTLKK